MTQAPATLDIFSYLDHRLFLKEWFSARQEANPRFSHRVFARLAQQRSPSMLGQVIKGERNLTPRTTGLFARAMGLSTDEGRYWRALVNFGQAKTSAAKQEAWEMITSFARFRTARPIDEQSFNYIARWFYPAIREMTRIPHFQADPKWVASRLLPRITVREAKGAIDLLRDLDLIRIDEDGEVHPTDTTVMTPPEVAGLAAHGYHRDMLTLACKSIESTAPEDRHLCAATVSIPGSLIPRLKAELVEFQKRVLNLCDGAEETPEQVYQIHLCLFPLSKPAENDTKQ